MSPTREPSPKGPVPPDELAYEQALEELETIVSALEGEALNLEQALDLYERGQALARRCASLLDQAELRVQLLSGEELVDLDNVN